MVNRAQIVRPVEGGVVHQGWLHPDTLPGVKALFAGRDFSVFAPRAVEWSQPEIDPAAKSFLDRLWPGRTRQPRMDRAQELMPGQPLPLPDESQAMVWSPLWLHGLEDPAAQVAEWLRVLKPEGGLFFSCLGPDTARELHQLATRLGAQLPDFADMHDLGDLLSRQGFSDPVMEMEKLTLTYTQPQALLREWRALAGNFLKERPKGCVASSRYHRALTEMEALRQGESGRISLTLELVYGHAWKVKRKPASHVTSVKISDIGGRKGSK